MGGTFESGKIDRSQFHVILKLLLIINLFWENNLLLHDLINGQSRS